MEQAALSFVDAALTGEHRTPPIFDERARDVDGEIDFALASICGPVVSRAKCATVAAAAIRGNPVTARVMCEQGGIQSRNAGFSAVAAAACLSEGHHVGDDMLGAAEAVLADRGEEVALAGVHASPANYCADDGRPIWRTVLFWVIGLVPLYLIAVLFLYSRPSKSGRALRPAGRLAPSSSPPAT